jgi:hypothetical protein
MIDPFHESQQQQLNVVELSSRIVVHVVFTKSDSSLWAIKQNIHTHTTDKTKTKKKRQEPEKKMLLFTSYVHRSSGMNVYKDGWKAKV